MGRRTSLKITDERERQLERATEIVASDPDDDPPMSVVTDAALAHLVESEENIRTTREEYDPVTVQELCNTSVLGLQYRTRIKSRRSQLAREGNVAISDIEIAVEFECAVKQERITGVVNDPDPDVLRCISSAIEIAGHGVTNTEGFFDISFDTLTTSCVSHNHR